MGAVAFYVFVDYLEGTVGVWSELCLDVTAPGSRGGPPHVVFNGVRNEQTTNRQDADRVGVIT